MNDEFIDSLTYSADGLIPAICVDHESDAVLMMAYMNRDSLRETIAQGLTCFWSRSRREYWVKGKTSGHTQEVVEIRTDCDRDTLLIRVRQNGAACHEGYFSCFFRKLMPDGSCSDVDERLVDPEAVYGKRK